MSQVEGSRFFGLFLLFLGWAYRRSSRTRNVPWDSVHILHSLNQCPRHTERGWQGKCAQSGSPGGGGNKDWAPS